MKTLAGKLKLKSFYLLLSEFNKKCEIAVPIGENVTLNWAINEMYLYGNQILYLHNSDVSKWQLTNGQ